MNITALIGKRLFIILIIASSSFKVLYSQDTVKTYIAYDVFKAFINEHSVTVGHAIGKHHLVTFSLGYVYDNRSIRKSFIGFSPNQDEFPVMVYEGVAVRAGYEYRLKPWFYAGMDIYGKHLQYKDHEFKDEDGQDNMVIYTRSEKSNFFGGHINIGFLLNIPKTPVLINPSVSFGGTLKYRNYTTEDIQYSWKLYGGHRPEGGTVSKREDNISVMMNLNIGIRIGK
jgi:hypothetical protein